MCFGAMAFTLPCTPSTDAKPQHRLCHHVAEPHPPGAEAEAPTYLYSWMCHSVQVGLQHPVLMAVPQRIQNICFHT